MHFKHSLSTFDVLAIAVCYFYIPYLSVVSVVEAVAVAAADMPKLLKALYETSLWIFSVDVRQRDIIILTKQTNFVYVGS